VHLVRKPDLGLEVPELRATTGHPRLTQ
jgi:hypothetical protein